MGRDWLKEHRTSSGLSQTQIANIAEMSQQGYSLIESGERRPSVKAAKKIASVLGFDWTRFYESEQDSA